MMGEDVAYAIGRNASAILRSVSSIARLYKLSFIQIAYQWNCFCAALLCVPIAGAVVVG